MKRVGRFEKKTTSRSGCDLSFIRELKHANMTTTEARTSSELRVSAIIFQLFKLIMLEKCALTILDLNWN